MNKINKLIKKAIKITPEDRFKLNLKRELKEQEPVRFGERQYLPIQQEQQERS
jgi:hypothetical protein